MKQFLPLLLLAVLFTQSCSLFRKKSEPAAPAMYSRSGGDRNTAYVDKFKGAAVLEMQRGGVPASIILAQGILESGAGSSELANSANNHFGIKCGSNWKGKTYKKIDDDKDANGKPIESCFRKYEKVEESYYDHGEFLRDPKKDYRYGFLFKLDRADYKGWAEGLESAGYSTSNTYSEKLIDIIDRYQLYKYDLPNNNNSDIIPDPQKPVEDPNALPGAQIPLPNPSNRIGRINDSKVILAREGETVADIAKAYRLNTNKVVEYNDRNFTPIEKLKTNTRVFIQQKRDKWNGRSTEHFVKDNQKMVEIAQLYGVRLAKLQQRNNLRAGQEPANGERIRLKGKRKVGDSPKLRDSTTEDPTPNTPPDTSSPSAPPPVKLDPNEDDLLDEIGGEKPKEDATTTPPGTQPTPPSGPKPPSVTGTPYPNDSSNQPNRPTPPPTKPPVVQDGYHLVVKGDTLFSIARKYTTTVANLKKWNGLKDDTVKIGQTLKIR